MGLPTITSYSPNTKIASAEMNNNLSNLRTRQGIEPTGDLAVQLKVLRQDDTANAYQANTIILTGWGYIQGDDSSLVSEVVTFGVTFDAAPIVIHSFVGFKTTSAPTAISDFTDGNPGGGTVVSTATEDISTSDFRVDIGRSDSSALASSRYWGYSWIALGQLA